MLLNQLPRLLGGYGKAFGSYPNDYKAAVIVICDLDGRDKGQFLAELEQIFLNCDPRPNGCVCLCVGEGEAWLLGDKDAVKAAFPAAKTVILASYEYDSICGTWETLANAVHSGGAASLSERGASEVGRMKSVWAAEIGQRVDIEANQSPSFQFFLATLKRLSDED
jgi:hypothetical protein